MVTTATHITDLYYRSTTGQLSDNERLQLNDWLTKHPVHAMHLRRLFDNEEFNVELSKRSPATLAALDDELYRAIQLQINGDKQTIGPIAHRVHFLKTAWLRYAAAIIILFGIGAYLWNTQQNKKPLITQTKPVPVKNDVLPGYDRAVLTLSSGEKIELNNTASETITDGSLSIKNNSGQLTYLPIPSNGGVDPGGANSHINPSGPGAGVGRGEILYNTMTTPNGGQYQLTLSDGTRVWLNAASSITYPTAFTGATRRVSITGEAYFEVKANPKNPFIVKVLPRSERNLSPAGDGEQQIIVLGTSFNVNAYPDEPAIKTSLLEGSIKIDEKILKPGQAYANKKITTTNIEQDIAWKNGVFDFNDRNLQQVLRQVARWYDVEVVYEKDVRSVVFIGEMSRNLQLSEVIEFLNGSKVKARLEGKKIIVSK